MFDPFSLSLSRVPCRHRDRRLASINAVGHRWNVGLCLSTADVASNPHPASGSRRLLMRNNVIRHLSWTSLVSNQVRKNQTGRVSDELPARPFSINELLAYAKEGTTAIISSSSSSKCFTRRTSNNSRSRVTCIADGDQKRQTTM